MVIRLSYYLGAFFAQQGRITSAAEQPQPKDDSVKVPHKVVEDAKSKICVKMSIRSYNTEIKKLRNTNLKFLLCLKKTRYCTVA